MTANPSGPLVSILIPCHNAAAYLAQTLDSALAQTWTLKEIIVVDDGSVDASASIAREFAARGVVLVQQANRGASAARNTAFQASHGEFIQFLDADDLLSPNKISAQLNLAQTVGQKHVYCCPWRRFGERSSISTAPTCERLCRDGQPVEWTIEKFSTGAMMHPAAWLAPRSVLEQAGPWNESLSLDDDGEYFTRVVLASMGVTHCTSGSTLYRSNIAGSLSARRSPQAWDSAFRSQTLCAEHLLRCERSERTLRACADMLQRLAYQCYVDAPAISDRCASEVARLGGSTLPPEGGRAFLFAARVFGWRSAKRLQRTSEYFRG